MIDRFQGEHAFLSNFYPSPMFVFDVVLNRKIRIPTVEHGFQADKTYDPKNHQIILEAETPQQAKRFGRSVKLRPDWEKSKQEVMLKWLRKKFSDDVFKQWLLDTGTAKLIEGNTWGDQEWGVCNGKGKNLLGKLLMQVREELSP